MYIKILMCIFFGHTVKKLFKSMIMYFVLYHSIVFFVIKHHAVTLFQITVQSKLFFKFDTLQKVYIHYILKNGKNLLIAILYNVKILQNQ